MLSLNLQFSRVMILDPDYQLSCELSAHILLVILCSGLMIQDGNTIHN